MNLIKNISFTFVLICVFANLVSCKKTEATPELVSVITILNDTLQSPIVAEGKITSPNNTQIIERGLLYGIDSNSLTVERGENIGWKKGGIYSGGFVIPSTNVGKIICGASNGSYYSNVLWLLNQKQYYFKSYAKTNSKVYYGNLVQLNSRTYKRDPRRFDIANVFWNPQYTLFDLQTDEIIYPDGNGNYNIWYATNENPVVNFISISANQLIAFRSYKFKTQANCKLWCDIKNGIIN